MLSFTKVPPTTYVLHYQNGRIRHEGAGLSFFYWAPTSTIIAVPLASADVPFVFQEATSDFQSVAIQGQLTYRVADPKRLASLLDFTVGRPNATYGQDASGDRTKLPERLVHALQTLTRAMAQRLTLRDILVSSDLLVAETLAGLRASDVVSTLGLEILSLSITSVKPTPETARALEAEAREALQRRADEAIYARRNAAVELERTIKENELNTEIAVEQKKRQVRESQMAAEIAVEQQRTTLVAAKVENERKETESRAEALKAILEPMKSVDWKTLIAVNSAMDSKLMISLAFQQLAQNAEKIGELNISPELLNTLLRPTRGESK